MSVPRTAEQLREEQIGRIRPLEGDVDERRNGHGGAGHGKPPPRFPKPRRGYGGGRIPLWQLLLLGGVLVLAGLLAGLSLGRLAARFAHDVDETIEGKR